MNFMTSKRLQQSLPHLKHYTIARHTLVKTLHFEQLQMANYNYEFGGELIPFQSGHYFIFSRAHLHLIEDN